MTHLFAGRYENHTPKAEILRELGNAQLVVFGERQIGLQAVLNWSRSHRVPHDAKKPVPVPPLHLTRYQENDAMMPC